MNPNDLLLKAIKERQGRESPFNEGILTADAYVKTLEQCVGVDLCYRYGSTKSVSFADVLTKAAKTLTYNNPEMLVEETLDVKGGETLRDGDLNEIELPKNYLMVFRHVLTTPRKDRDGDVLRTQGARPDPRMLLLWQHVHTLPIGKMLAISEHNSKKLSLISAIVDINELAHDAAVMVDNKMGRFSHGFRALDFTEVKEDSGNGRTTSPGGFDIKSFEIMEESLVSVPANTDSETEEVILSLVSGGKLTSPLMKGYGRTIKDKRPTQVAVGRIPVNVDLNVTINGKSIQEIEQIQEEEKNDEPIKTKCAGKTDCGCGCGGKKPTPEKADETHGEEKATDDHEVKSEKKTCPECGEQMVDGRCQKCGYTEKKDTEVEGEKDVVSETEELETEKSVEGEKAGRVLSSKNMNNLTKACEHLKSMEETEHLMTNAGRTKCREAHRLVDEVVQSANKPGGEVLLETSVSVTCKDAMAIFIAKADSSLRLKMIESLQALNLIENRQKQTVGYKKFRSRK